MPRDDQSIPWARRVLVETFDAWKAGRVEALERGVSSDRRVSYQVALEPRVAVLRAD